MRQIEFRVYRKIGRPSCPTGLTFENSFGSNRFRSHGAVDVGSYNNKLGIVTFAVDYFFYIYCY